MLTQKQVLRELRRHKKLIEDDSHTASNFIAFISLIDNYFGTKSVQSEVLGTYVQYSTNNSSLLKYIDGMIEVVLQGDHRPNSSINMLSKLNNWAIVGGIVFICGIGYSVGIIQSSILNSHEINKLNNELEKTKDSMTFFKNIAQGHS